MKTEYTPDGDLVLRTPRSRTIAGGFLLLMGASYPVLAFLVGPPDPFGPEPWESALFLGGSLFCIGMGLFVVSFRRVFVFTPGSRTCRYAWHLWPFRPREREITFEAVRLGAPPWWAGSAYRVLLCPSAPPDGPKKPKDRPLEGYFRPTKAVAFAHELCKHTNVPLRTDSSLDSRRALWHMRARMLLSFFGAILVSFMLGSGPWCIRQFWEERREAQLDAFETWARAVAGYVRNNNGQWPADWQDLGFDEREARQVAKWVEVDFTFDPKAVLEDPSAVRAAVVPRWDFRDEEAIRRAQPHFEWWMLAHEVGLAHGEWVVLPEEDLPPDLAAEAADPGVH